MLKYLHYTATAATMLTAAIIFIKGNHQLALQLAASAVALKSAVDLAKALRAKESLLQGNHLVAAGIIMWSLLVITDFQGHRFITLAVIIAGTAAIIAGMLRRGPENEEKSIAKSDPNP